MNNIPKKADESVLKELAQAYGDETKARELLESWRWPNGPVCPHCRNSGEKKILKLEAPTTRQRRVRPGVYFCGACRRQFTVTVGTVLERSHVPLAKWLMALPLLCSSKKSLSANQIHRMIGVTYKTAWFLCHRIRLGMTPQLGAAAKLQGIVEVDEAFVGPKAKPKSAVVALVERHGLARVKVIASVTQKNLGAALSECVSPEAVVNTDEHPSYKQPLLSWKAHQTVNHSRGGDSSARTRTDQRLRPRPPNPSSPCSNAPSSALGIIFPGSIYPDMPMNSPFAGTPGMTPMTSGWRRLPAGLKANA
jgi:transposase-like protein